MSDETRTFGEAMREGAVECVEDYHQMVAEGEALTYEDGSVANFATVYMASRLVHNGYADAFMNTEYWDTKSFAEQVRDYIEAEIVESAKLPDGQFGLDLAFLMLSQVEWIAVAQVLRDVIVEREKAMLLLQDGDNAAIPSVESQKISPEEWQKLTGQSIDGSVTDQW